MSESKTSITVIKGSMSGGINIQNLCGKTIYMTQCSACKHPTHIATCTEKGLESVRCAKCGILAKPEIREVPSVE